MTQRRTRQSPTNRTANNTATTQGIDPASDPATDPAIDPATDTEAAAAEVLARQPEPVPASAGRFPPAPTQIAPLPALAQARTATRMAVAFRDIACFSGKPGTGKTTSVTLATSDVPDITWRYCVPPQRATTKGAMLALYEAVFGWTGPQNEREATDALVRRLAEGDLGVVIDEVHHVGLLGMQQYRHVWDRACVLDQAFPMLLVGCDVPATLERADEVRTRIARWVLFDFIQNADDLETLAHELHPRLAASRATTLATINTDIADGNIRTWAQFAKHIDFLGSTTARPTALTGEDIRLLQTMMGTLG